MSKKKINNSDYTYLIENLDGKRIRQYKKKYKEYNGRVVSVPINKILKLLDTTNIKHPKLLKNRLFYIEMEYIDGKSVYAPIDKNTMIGLVVNNVYDMHRVNCDSIKKYIKWKNNTEFLFYSVDVLDKYIRKDKNIEKLKSIGLNVDNLRLVKQNKLDDLRPLSLIHGDINSSNFLCVINDYYLIDWEQATYGDIAYELANHFTVENYTQEENIVVIDRLCRSLGFSQINLVKDIKIYSDFELIKRCFIDMNETINLAKKGKDYSQLLNVAYSYYNQLVSRGKIENFKTYDEIKAIITNK